MPLSAMVARAEIMESWSVGAHGSTYGGNPVACAAALATIELLTGGLVDNAAVRGEQALTALRELQAKLPGLITDVRGMGLMLGVEFDSPEHAEDVQYASFERGLLVLECGKQTVRLCPPLTVTADEMATGMRLFAEACAAVAAAPGTVAAHAQDAGALHPDGEVDA